MKLTKHEEKLIKKYNTPETVVVLSSYPDKNGESATRNAIANYTRELVSEMRNDASIVVLAEMIEGPEIYEENEILVVRCYERDSILLVGQVVKMIARFTRVNQVLSQFEFGVYGGNIVTLSMLTLGFFVRAMGKHYTMMMHQVTDNLGDLAEHLGLSEKGVQTKIYNLGIKMFYRLNGLGASRVLVHNMYLKDKLKRYVRGKKVGVVSHGVRSVSKMSRTKARRLLKVKESEKLILVFGYLSWYKGSDWAVKEIGKIQAKYPEKKIRLIMAGGKSGTLGEMSYYRKYAAKLTLMAKKRGIEITGYVPDSKKSMYFSAADLVIMPHRVAMSESGVMAHVMAYGVPYMLSEARAVSMELPADDIRVFSLNKPEEFGAKMLELLQDRQLARKFGSEIARIGRERSWSKVAKILINELPGKQEVAYTGNRYAKVTV